MSLLNRAIEALDRAEFKNTEVEDALREFMKFLDSELDEADFAPSDNMLDKFGKLSISLNNANLDDDEPEEEVDPDSEDDDDDELIIK